jgi:hypothetical protein
MLKFIIFFSREKITIYHFLKIKKKCYFILHRNYIFLCIYFIVKATIYISFVERILYYIILYII